MGRQLRSSLFEPPRGIYSERLLPEAQALDYKAECLLSVPRTEQVSSRGRGMWVGFLREEIEQSWGPPPLLTSSLKGKGGTVGSKRNMSSHSSARRHSARLSTSRAMGPTASCTVGQGGEEREITQPRGVPGLGLKRKMFKTFTYSQIKIF